jgi:hypothetical protein
VVHGRGPRDPIVWIVRPPSIECDLALFEIFDAVWQAVLAQVILAALVAAASFAYVRMGWRRLFRADDPECVTVVVSASSHTNTGAYRRASTGLGQVRAIADLAPRFAQAYWRQRLDQVFTSESELHERVEGDLLVLGGEKTNVLAWELLEAWSMEEGFPVLPCSESSIRWFGESFCSAGDGTILTKDYGLIVRNGNPFASGRGRTAILIAGASTAGVHAASRVFTSDPWFRKAPAVAALVECRVRDGFPVQVRVADRMVRERQTGAWLRLTEGEAWPTRSSSRT